MRSGFLAGRKSSFRRTLKISGLVTGSQFKTHVVKKGDTLSRIARIYRVALEPLLQINKLKKASHLSVGMNLLIPVPINHHVSIPTAIEKAPNGKDPSAKSSQIIQAPQEDKILENLSALSGGGGNRINGLKSKMAKITID